MASVTESVSVKRSRKSGEGEVVTKRISARDGEADVAAEKADGRFVTEARHGGNGNGRGGEGVATDQEGAPEERHASGKDRATDYAVDSLCAALQSLERQRRFALKQRIRGENAITAFVAWNACGFHTGIASENEREELWKKAGKLIKEIDSGDTASGADGPLAAEDDRQHDTEVDVVQDDSGDDVGADAEASGVTGVVRISQISRKAWKDYEKALVKEMEELAGQLPVAPWLSHPDRRGISLGMLATIVGESGNLSNYPNPAKLWKRLFGAPYEKGGKTMMPSRWRLEKGLSAEEWEEVGYSPQRHATQQQLKENIVRQNGDGPYRRRYDEAKARTRETHPEWWVCPKCDGKGKVGRKKCQDCKGTGEKPLHAHRHAQLLAAKRFVRDLWNKWHGESFDPDKVCVPR